MRELLVAAQSIADEVVADRRAIHARPELAYQERETAAFVKTRLGDLGIEFRGGVGDTGVIGLVRGGHPGQTVLLRADMDALPITEESNTPFASEHKGVMHACDTTGI